VVNTRLDTRQAVGGVKMLNFQARGISATRNDTALIAALRDWQHKGSARGFSAVTSANRGLRLVHHRRDSRDLVLREIIARRDQTQKLHEGEEIAGRSEEEL
jgi:hypothetical protein